MCCSHKSSAIIPNFTFIIMVCTGFYLLNMPGAKVRLRRYLLKAKQANLNPYQTSVDFIVNIKSWNLAHNYASETSMGSLWTRGSKSNFTLSFEKHCYLTDSLGDWALHRERISLLSGWMDLVYLVLEQEFHRTFWCSCEIKKCGLEVGPWGGFVAGS